MTRVVVIGAAGRMGRLLVKNILISSDLRLVGAIEAQGNPTIGSDAGALAGLPNCGLQLTDNLKGSLANADVIIDFSTGRIVENAKQAFFNNVGIVIGTTGLGQEEKNELKKLAEEGARIVCAPNMSVGVNLLFYLAGYVAKILGDSYDIELVELHHNQKKDAPSGTAVRLVEIMAEARNMSMDSDICYGRKGITGTRAQNEIGVHAVRCGDVVGEHTIYFSTCGERVELTHKASTRETFALGALRGARFISKSAPGLYDMQDVLGISKSCLDT
ncbi:MAG TPA: 4-hydroxy-tetrahydrodipicolinate reductase [Lentisphaeria bacterium]|nr:MAG: 4-hydroxy-tetrahydrodipicolinate reductase [Lentisphaerae bacterium GWF2_38_69]HBM17011.1 4-hydroxy-tetrahydrodipicolinate reductase [Lentisphaeria bacterium]